MVVDSPRVIVTAHDGTIVGDLDPAKLAGLVAISEVNGENAMTVTTTQELAKGDRLLWRDGMGHWHEYVIESDECAHDMPSSPMHAYYAVWSIQHDLSATITTAMPGTGGTPASATVALQGALEGTGRWVVGTVDVATTGSASFWRKSGWEAMQELVKTWGGELRATVEVGAVGVTARKVDLLQHVGSRTATRRYDYGHDATGVTRTIEDQLWTARVMPLGAAQETEGGGYGRKLTIESVNDGIAWLEDADAVPLTRVPDGRGGWEVPVQVVENGEIEDAAALKAWALANLKTWTTPKVSYEVGVVQLDGAGESALGVALGDECAVVDATFGEGGLRLSARVLRIEQDLLDPTQTTLTISNLRTALGDQLASLSRATSEVRDMVEGMSAAQSSTEWVQNLLGRINTEANATGGYTYITQGQGIRAYDTPVSDPLVGVEASKVVEVKGGTIRIANTRDSAGQWEWKTVFVSGHVLSELIEAIGSESGAHAQLTPYGLAVYDAATLLSEFAGDHASILPDWAEAGRTVGDIGYISIVGDSGRIETEIGPTRDIMRIRAFGPLYLQAYDGVYAQSDNGGLQTSVNLASLVSTAWADLPLASGVTEYDYDSTPRYRKVLGSMVAVSGAVKPTSQAAAGGSVDIGTLPEGFRPSRYVCFLCQGSGNAVWLLGIEPTGVISCSRYRNGSSNAAIGTSAWLTFHCTFAL